MEKWTHIHSPKGNGAHRLHHRIRPARRQRRHLQQRCQPRHRQRRHIHLRVHHRRPPTAGEDDVSRQCRHILGWPPAVARAPRKGGLLLPAPGNGEQTGGPCVSQLIPGSPYRYRQTRVAEGAAASSFGDLKSVAHLGRTGDGLLQKRGNHGCGRRDHQDGRQD